MDITFRYIVFAGFLCIFFLLGCDKTSNGLDISFSKVVGKYNGISKKCSSTTSDTICSTGMSNVAEIFLLNLTTVVVQDQKNVFGSAKVPFKKTENIDGAVVHYFENADMTLGMQFNQTKDSIFVFNKVTESNGAVVTDFFSGKR
ncbi:MAG: hypothetical protein IPN89_07585 [Saprospiraceae bacterium]|nr:hypothetical protein [Saprospiraceae bacterium]